MVEEKKLYLIIGIIIGIVTTSSYFYIFAPRYEIKRTHSEVLKIDKWTGNSWRYINNKWQKINPETQKWQKIDLILERALDTKQDSKDIKLALKKLRDRYPILKEQLLKAISDIKEQKEKNPTLAGVLALIPGAGHLYCGRPRDGAVAFLFNSALFLAARHAFDNGNNALGGLIAFTGAGFYSGSIYGSISSAHKLNRQHRNRSIQKVRELLAPKLVLKRSFFHPGTICLALELPLGQD